MPAVHLSKDTTSRHILLLYKLYGHGGTESLILRMANWLHSNGIRTSLILGEVEPRHIGLPQCPVAVIGESTYDRLVDPNVLSSVLSSLNVPEVTHIYTFNNNDLLISLHIAHRFKSGIKVMAGCYFPWGYLYPRWRWNFRAQPRWERGPIKYVWRYLCAFAFDKCLPDRNKIFTVRAIRDRHEANYRRPLRDSRIWFVPLDFLIFKMRERKPVKGLIVSIGRICETKSYNRYMIDVIRVLQDQGLDVRWNVYGYGELQDELQSIVKEKNLSDRIHFKGIVRYEDIPLAVQDAYLFVGTGTTIMEAGWCGVVCIPALEDFPKPFTYGYLHEVPDLATGVAFENPPEKEIAGLIKEAFGWSDAEYRRVCDQTRAVVGQFDSKKLMPEFMRICESVDEIELGFKERVVLHVYKLVSRILKWARLLSKNWRE